MLTSVFIIELHAGFAGLLESISIHIPPPPHNAWLLACIEHINAWWVSHVESVSKMGLVISITYLQYMGLHVLDWPIRV